jgi:hypothetical protein
MQRGRPQDPNKLIFRTIGLRQNEWDWLSAWNDGNVTYQMADLMARCVKCWPKGPQSVPVPEPGAKNAPGTKTSLKRRIKELEVRLQALLIEIECDPDGGECRYERFAKAKEILNKDSV